MNERPAIDRVFRPPNLRLKTHRIENRHRFWTREAKIEVDFDLCARCRHHNGSNESANASHASFLAGKSLFRTFKSEFITIAKTITVTDFTEE